MSSPSQTVVHPSSVDHPGWGGLARDGVRHAPGLMALVLTVWIFIQFLTTHADRQAASDAQMAEAVQELAAAVGELRGEFRGRDSRTVFVEAQSIGSGP